MTDFKSFSKILKKALSVNITIFILRFIYNIIIARILIPQEFGVVAFVIAVEAILLVLVDFGLSVIIIQDDESKIEKEHYIILSIFNLIVAAIFFLLAILCFKNQIDDKYYYQLLYFIPISLVINSVIIPLYSLMRKELRFNIINSVDLINAVSTITMILILAVIFNMGPSAVLLGILFGYLIKVYTLIRHSPIAKPHGISFKQLKSILSKSIYISISNVVNIFSSKIDDLLIGKYLGSSILGAYAISWNLMMVPLSRINGTINMVSLPFYKKIEGELLEKLFSKNLFLVVLIGVPLYMMLAISSEEIIELLFGDNWIGASKYLYVFSFIGVTKIINNPGGNYLLSYNKNKIFFWWNILWFFILATAFSYYSIFLPNIQLLLRCFLIVSIISVFIWYGILLIATPLNLNYLNGALVVLTASIISFIIVVSVKIQWSSLLLSLLLKSLLYIFTYGVILYLSKTLGLIKNHYFIDLNEFTNGFWRK